MQGAREILSHISGIMTYEGAGMKGVLVMLMTVASAIAAKMLADLCHVSGRRGDLPFAPSYVSWTASPTVSRCLSGLPTFPAFALPRSNLPNHSCR